MTPESRRSMGVRELGKAQRREAREKVGQQWRSRHMVETAAL